MLGNFSYFYCRLLTFFKANFFENSFRNTYQSVKRYGSFWWSDLRIFLNQFHGTTFKMDHPSFILVSLISIGSVVEIGDNCIQNFYLGRYIVGYGWKIIFTVTRHKSGVVKRYFRMYIQ